MTDIDSIIERLDLVIYTNRTFLNAVSRQEKIRHERQQEYEDKYGEPPI